MIVRTYADLKAALEATDAETLRMVVANVVLSLYGVPDDEGDSLVIDPEKEFDASTVADVAEDLEELGFDLRDGSEHGGDETTPQEAA